MSVILGLVAALTGVVGAVLHGVNAADGRTIEPSFWLLSSLAAVAFGLTGAVVGARARVPAVALVLTGIGLGEGVAMLVREYALLGDLPLDGAALWVGAWLWAPSHLAIGVLLPLVLPDGRLPSARWRPALVLAVAALGAQALVWALTPYDRVDFPFDVRGLRNPVGVDAAASTPVVAVAAALTVAAVVTSLASLAVRWRAATGDRRQQLKWLWVGGAAAVLLFVAGLATPPPAGELVASLAVLPLPVAAAVAARRHRLWDVDLVVSAGLAYAILSVLVAAVYAAVVSLLGATTGASVVATALVAMLLLPVHARVQALVNEWVHGEADDPVTALARLGDRLETTADPADVADRLLPGVVARIADLLRAPYAAVALADGEVVEHGTRPEVVDTIALRYAGTGVGALELTSRPRSRGERRHLDRLAAQASVAVHSVVLAREARRARQQVVVAREEERRTLRRDLHDEIGPVIAALALQAETARDLVAADPGAATTLLDRLVPRLNGAVRDVRALVHDLRPPTLDELGLAGAVRELAARFHGPGRAVRAEADEVGELPAAVELAAYRIVAEALNNAVRHGDPDLVTVRLARDGRDLALEVTDDGTGVTGGAGAGLGLASMRSRAEELGGTCDIAAAPGARGTRVTVRLPAGAQERTPQRVVPA